LERIRDAVFGGTIKPDRVEANDTVTDTLDTEDINDSNDGQAWETLREVGYESGDVLPLTVVNTGLEDEQSFTSTSYTGLYNNLFSSIPITTGTNFTVDDIRFRLTGVVKPGTNETVDIRVTDAASSPVFAEVADVTSTGIVDSGWSEPSNSPEKTIGPRTQAKTNPGDNTSTVERVSLLIGVEI